MPGLGLWRNINNPVNLLWAPVCYGLVGYGLVKMNSFKKRYDEYLQATEQIEINEKYDAASRDRSIFIGTISTGVGLMIFQTVLTYSWGKYNNLYRERKKVWKEVWFSIIKAFIIIIFSSQFRKYERNSAVRVPPSIVFMEAPFQWIVVKFRFYRLLSK